MSLDVAKLERQAAELDAELARSRFSGRSADGVATAMVTGQGRLVGLTIADHALRGAHPQAVGPAVVEAVNAARRAAAAVGGPKLSAVLDKNQEWQPESVPPTADARDVAAPPSAPTTTSRSARGEVEDENFEEIDFLEYPDDDTGGRGRW
ncbi:YbaB/EbfC family nucleoid-associated protein [Amycolatopsis samaneae]|uniref:YbaB/EbfC family nucleoid-associated protein n=1 Tax=Amycolatopsis samaneae TaxID=664691 RepID=A0ABW5G817_9PSEU